MHRLTISFLLKLISAKILSVLFEIERRRDVMSSLMERRISPPFEHLSSLYGFENPSSRNCAEGNESSSFVSSISRISKLSQITFSRNSDLFLIEFMFN